MPRIRFCRSRYRVRHKNASGRNSPTYRPDDPHQVQDRAWRIRRLSLNLFANSRATSLRTDLKCQSCLYSPAADSAPGRPRCQVAPCELTSQPKSRKSSSPCFTRSDVIELFSGAQRCSIPFDMTLILSTVKFWCGPSMLHWLQLRRNNRSPPWRRC